MEITPRNDKRSLRVQKGDKGVQKKMIDIPLKFRLHRLHILA